MRVSTSRSRSQEFWFVMELSDHRRPWRQRETVGSPFCEIEPAVRPSWSRTPGTPKRERGWIRRRASRCNSDHFCECGCDMHTCMCARDALQYRSQRVDSLRRIRTAVQSNSRQWTESCTRKVARNEIIVCDRAFNRSHNIKKLGNVFRHEGHYITFMYKGDFSKIPLGLSPSLRDRVSVFSVKMERILGYICGKKLKLQFFLRTS